MRITKAPLLFAIAALAAAGCGLTPARGVEGTLAGVNRQQALVAAHRVLSDRSYGIERVEAAGGTMVTTWRDRGLRSTRFRVVAAPATVYGSDGVRLSVQAFARDRAVHGWTEGYPVEPPARRLLRDITEAAEAEARAPILFEEEAEARAPILFEEEPEPEPEPEPQPEPECTTSRECPPGQHCGSGRCVWECADDRECADDQRCDRRGRCVPRPTPPLPAAEPGDAGEQE